MGNFSCIKGETWKKKGNFIHITGDERKKGKEKQGNIENKQNIIKKMRKNGREQEL